MNPLQILLLDDNLMSATRVENGLRSGGNAVKLARRVPENGAFDLVVLNFGSRSLGALELLPTLRERFAGAEIWGFCGHREVEIWRAAQNAGVKMISNERAMSEIAGEIEAFVVARSA